MDWSMVVYMALIFGFFIALEWIDAKYRDK